MRLCLGIIAYCLVALVQAAPVQIEGVRIWAAPDSTRVVFDISGPVTHELNLLSNPYRAVIDIKDSELAHKLSQPGATDKFLQAVRSGRHKDDLRVVLDLKKFSQTKSFQLKPNRRYGHRLVVDLFSKETQESLHEASASQEAPTNKLRDVVVAIDAGHGGEDPGALGPKGTYEKHVVLAIAKKVAALVNQQHGMKAVLIREGDYFLRLRKRIQKARKHKADLFVSIHADSFRDPRVKGSSVFVLSHRGASSEHARWLAEKENASDLIGGVSLDDKDDVLASVLLDLSLTASLEASIDVAERVLQDMKKVGKLHKPRVESAAFAVLKSPDIPSILIETAYISNPEEERKLLNVRHQQKIARAITNGLRGYFDRHAPEGTILAARVMHEHLIARGDTLSTIAEQYRVSLNTLREVNGLKSDRIRTGQKLTIPVTGG